MTMAAVAPSSVSPATSAPAMIAGVVTSDGTTSIAMTTGSSARRTAGGWVTLATPIGWRIGALAAGVNRTGPFSTFVLGGRGRERAGALARLRDVLVGVVGAAHERAGRDVVEAERVRVALERGELVGMPVADDREVALGRAQVLADRDDLDVVIAQLPEHVDDLVVGLAEADHAAGLRHDLVAARRLRVAQHARRAQELRAAPCDRVEPRDDLDVVVEDVGALVDDLGERHLLAAEVGRQHLDLALGRLVADLADDADERGRAVVGEVVAVDARDDRVAKAHQRHRASDARGLERVVPGRLAGLDVAEAAAARAGVAEDHERRGPPLPALADVRA